MTPRAPSFSIVVPTHRRPDQLRSLARSLAAMVAAPGDGGTGGPRPTFELVVVDDGATLGAHPSLPDPGMPWQILGQVRSGPAAARNAGAQAARGGHLVFVDDDCEVRPDWGRRLAEAVAAQPEAMIAGRTHNRLRSAFARCSQALTDATSATSLDGPGAFAPSCNLVVPVSGWRAVGGFDSTFPLPAGEDRDLCERWVATGRRIAVAPEIVVDHSHHMGPVEFVAQQHRYGRGARHLDRRRAERGQARLRPRRPAYYRALVGAAVDAGLSRPVAAALVSTSQLAVASGYLRGTG